MNRHGKNPLITPSDVVPSLPGRKVECVFNAGVTEYHGEIILLLRVAESVIMMTHRRSSFRFWCSSPAAGRRQQKRSTATTRAMILATRVPLC